MKLCTVLQIDKKYEKKTVKDKLRPCLSVKYKISQEINFDVKMTIAVNDVKLEKNIIAVNDF